MIKAGELTEGAIIEVFGKWAEVMSVEDLGAERLNIHIRFDENNIEKLSVPSLAKFITHEDLVDDIGE